MNSTSPALKRSVPSDAKVSVLIRTMDRPSLSAAVASVLMQSFAHWEILIVNASGHGLTQLTPELARRVALVLEPGCQLGRSAAANALLDAAGGNYALFLDDDDRLLPEHLQKLVPVLDSDPTLKACYSDAEGTFSAAGDAANSKKLLYQHEFDPVALQLQNYLPIHAVLFRLQSVRENPACRFDEKLALFEDWDFWLQLIAKGDFRRVSGVSVWYALNSASGSGHAMGELRQTMLHQFGERQLARWSASDIAKLIDWQAQRSQALEQAKQEADSRAQQIDQARVAIADLNRSLLEAQQSALATQQSLEAARTQAQAQQQTIARLMQELGIARTQTAAQQLEIEKLTLNLDAAQAAAQAQQQAIDRLTQELSVARTQTAAQQVELEKLGQLRLEHLRQLSAYDARLLAIYRSNSWRLTRPLRVVRRGVSWIASPTPWRLLRNGWRAAAGEIRRHDLSGFLRRLPHYLRNHKTYTAVLTSQPPQGKANLFQSTPPQPPRTLRLHPDLSGDKTAIDARISVVIPTLNAGDEFERLLRKLRAQQGIMPLEIVVVDSGSQDQTVALAQAAQCRVVEIAASEFSHSHARNLGAAQASGDYLLFMVQDAYPIGNYWAYGMLRYLLDHADSGLVAASCSEYSRSDSDMMYDSMIDTHYRFLGCHEHDRIGDYQSEEHMALRSRGQLSDVACLISHQIFNQYRYRGDYAEDLDLGIRLIRDGHRVAMLASVKVVHSHNRAAFYYMKRSYVDVIFLVGMFDDFLIPAVESVPGLLLGIVSCARHVSALLPRLEAAQPGIALSKLLVDWISVCRQQCKVLHSEGVCALGDERLDNYVNSLERRLALVTLDKLAHGEARRFADSFFARLEHFNAFVERVYGTHDEWLRGSLKDAIGKTFAASAGSALGFMYMDCLRAGAADQSLVQPIDAELRAGV